MRSFVACLCFISSACGLPNQGSEPLESEAPKSDEKTPVAQDQDIELVGDAEPRAESRQLLLFEFPDGVRGGFGKIRGRAQATETEVSLVELVENCGGLSVHEPPAPTHRSYIAGMVATEPLQVVRCVQEATSRHFNVRLYPTVGLNTQSISTDPALSAILLSIEDHCELGGYYLTVEAGRIVISARPEIRQLPLDPAKHECARRLIQKRLGQTIGQ